MLTFGLIKPDAVVGMPSSLSLLEMLNILILLLYYWCGQELLVSLIFSLSRALMHHISSSVVFPCPLLVIQGTYCNPCDLMTSSFLFISVIFPKFS